MKKSTLVAHYKPPKIKEKEFVESLNKAIQTTRKPPGFSALINKSKAVTAAEIETFLYKHPKYILRISSKLSHPHLINLMSRILAAQRNDRT